MSDADTPAKTAYGFLGGSLADGVVKAVRTFLLSANFRVVRFNSRGVGRSGGKASWTGRPEADDFRVSGQDTVPHDARFQRTDLSDNYASTDCRRCVRHTALARPPNHIRCNALASGKFPRTGHPLNNNLLTT